MGSHGDAIDAQWPSASICVPCCCGSAPASKTSLLKAWAENGTPPTSVDSSAKVSFNIGEGGITGIELTVKAVVEDLEEADFQRLAEDVTDLGFVESSPKQDGRNMIMVLGPHKKKAEARVEAKAAKEERMAERAADAAEEAAERSAARAAGPVAQKKERGRSENLDPEIEA